MTFLAFLFGTCLGSFLNVCIDRLPRGGSLLGPPSHCPACGRRLSAFELVPLASYLWLRGRCRTCGVAIGARTPVVELAAGALFASLHWFYGFGGHFWVLAYYGSLLLVLAAIDIEHRLILNKIVYPALPVSFALSFFVLPDPHFPDIGVASALLGFAVAFAFFASPNLVYREGMGWGDIKLAALVGMATGFPLALVAAVISVVAGGLVAIGLVLFGGRGRKEGIPFGPYLCLGAMAALIWGEAIVDWYKDLVGLV